MSERLASLSREERRRLVRRLQEQPAAAPPAAARPIPRRTGDGPQPLSFAQQRLWFVDQLQPGNAAYNIASALRLSGALDIPALAASLAGIVHRHEALRTTFALVDGQPVQVVGPPPPAVLPEVDLAGLPGEPREAELRRLVAEDARRPFDLARGPLLRTLLVRLAPHDHAVLSAMHHIVSDAWSLGVFVRELTALYEGLATRRPRRLPELPIQYADYARWQREWLQGAVLEEQLAYWRRQLGGTLPTLELPADRPRPAVRTHRGGHLVARFPAVVSDGLRALARAQGASLFMVLLAAFQTLFHRLSGQEDLVVGTPVSGRNRVETEGLIGFFINTLTLRGDLSGDPTFREMVGRARQTALGAFAHQDAPFERLVEELHPQRDLARHPLFQVILVLHNTPEASAAPEMAGLELSSLPVESAASRVDLTLEMTDHPQGMWGVLEHSADLFEKVTAERLLGHLGTLATAAVAEPGLPLSRLPLLTPEERHQLATTYHRSGERFAATPVHERFAAAAARQPDAVAVSCGERRLTYGELATAAGHLARRLRGLGVGPESRVGICLERSPEMIVAILGILQAGGAYVPLDPDLPRERLDFLLADSGVAVLITRSGLEIRLPQAPGFQPRVQAPVDPGNAAYVIYTSGSTGRPKGVVVTHGNVARLLAATQEWFGFGPGDVWTLFHSYAFDFSVWEIWGALAYGGRLVVVPWEVSRSPEDFLDLLETEEVTVLNQTPSAFRQLVAADAESRRALALRTVVFGGEALDPASLAPWFDRHGDREPLLVNMYGITETTVHVTYRPLSRADLASGSRIGVPIPDLQTHVLDRHFEPMPYLAPGEIHVGGAGLARGYLGRPELTAERFVPDPFSREPGARLYRSGDLARRRPDGELEYLGRIDHQVKIRGFRIELGEIQAALAGHPDLREAVVLARGRGGDGDRLVAWVVPHNGQAPAVSSLRGWLEARLPSYMVPAAFVAVDRLPLTPNGKLDRDALPDPEAGRLEPEALYEPPHGPAEELLAEIWAQVLGVERVGAEDNFFALGGDSIRSIQVRSDAERAGLGFTIQQLFQYPTVRSLAREVRGGSEDAARVPPFSLVDPRDRERLPEGLEDAYPLARLQAGMLFHSELTPESAVYHDVFTYHLHGPLDPEALRATLARVSARHPVLRTSFDLSTFHEPLQLVHETAEMPLGIDDVTGLSADGQEAAIAAWLEREKAQPFDWRQPPLARLQIHRRSAGSFQLGFAFHHALLDGWSVASLVTELFRTYTALTQGRELPDEAPPPVSYRDFVAAEQRALASEESRSYWTAVAREGARTRLPRWPAPAETRPRGPVIRSVAVPLVPEVSDGLKKASRQAGTPLKSVLLAAHLRCLALLSGEREATTGLISNGRIEAEGGERVLGLFLNTVPLRVRLAGGTWLDLVREVFAAERALLPHRRFPMAELQRLTGGDPLFEAVFNYVHFHVYEGLASGPGGLRVEQSSGFEEVHFPFAANFSLLHANAPVLLWLDHDASLFGPGQIEEIASLYQGALAAIAADPAARWEKAPLLPAEEHRRLLDLGLGTAAPAPAAPGIHELFAAQARRTPGALAVLFDQETGTTQRLTYAELDELSARLARALAVRGAGPETLVALRARRSPALLAAILGVLKAGAAYLPLDPDAPAERTAAILADSGAALVLGEEDLPGLLASQAEAPLPPGDALRPAYAIYTSGSTGMPKGVVVHHGSLVNFCLAVVEAVGLGPGERILQFAPPSFDASALQIFPALISGATVVVHPDPAGLSSEEILQLCLRQGMTVLDLPAALWRQWVETMSAAGEPLPAAIRVYMTGGERLSRETLRQWAPLTGGETLFLSSYGPTEATVTSTFFAVTAREAADLPEAPPPLGRPLPGTFLRLLDPFGEPAPVGTPGEIHLGGAGLARGYLHRPDLTAERFVPDPFGSPGDRLYCTGDLARFLPDGGIEFLGRTDHQVKIRGFRVEPAEVEAALARLPVVREAVVLAREHAAGDRRLVAWLVAEPGADATPGMLREALAQRLPDFMIPSAFVLLPELPLLPSGKVDHRALPAPESAPRTAAGHVAPRNPVEETVAGIWADVLGVERVGVLDDFFALGGHSLVATQVITRIRRAFGIDLQLRHVFESPTVAGVAAAILADPERREAVEAQLRQIPRRADAGPAPLSFGQQRLWFLYRLDPANPTFNLPEGVRLAGDLDLGALRGALAALVHRHETLRTVFREVDGEAVQVVAPPLPPPLPCLDLAGLPGPAREAETARLSEEIADHPFDLRQGPALRTALLRLGSREHAILLVLHHIVTDAWSMGLLVRELTVLYTAFAAGRPSPLPELPIQYADFAAWQREQLQGEPLEAQIAFWRERLAGAPTTLQLPSDRPRPAVQSFRGASVPAVFDREAALALRELARTRGATLFMALVAALGVLLQRSTGEDDLLVGSPVAGRGRLETEGLIGFFVNMLSLRIDLTGDPDFPTLLARVREMVLAAEAHQDLPFERLVDALGLPRDLSQTPLFQVVLAYQTRAAGGDEALRDLALSGVGFVTRAAQYDLHFLIDESPQHLAGALHYHTDLFDEATAARLARCFATLVGEIAGRPDLPVSRIPLLTAEERRQIVAWNNRYGARLGSETPVHELFAAAAARNPGAEAVSCEGRRLTYGELAAAAGRLARRLRRLGVGPESRAGICLERSPEMVVAIVAILQAGGAYVPLDPDLPGERLAFLLEDSGVAVLVTSSGLESRLPVAPGLPRLLVDDEESVTVPPLPWEREPGGEGSAAYVIYTSGSTGRPKGVVVTHGNLSRLLSATQGWFGFGPEDVWTLFHSYAFDFSVWEIWGALAYGGRLVVVPWEVSRSPGDFLALLEAERVTVLNQTPSAFRQLAAADAEHGRELALRFVVFGGEALDPASLAPWFDRRGDRTPRLVNMYGITETTVHVTYRPLSRADLASGSRIGVPIPDLQTHVLDRHLEPLPLLAPGEIHVGGAGLARGYLDRPELTAGRFVPDPFSPEAGARLYRSGDLARRRPDGELEYLGRIDHQVKIRGFRIELGEIQAALAAHPAVREAVVLARGRGGDGDRLAAWLVPHDGQSPTVAELRAHLERRLPTYMVPAAYVLLDRFPLTPNGKLDRRALPDPDPSAAQAEVEYAAPETPAEAALAQAWSEVLGVPRVGAHDNFFALGGDSILSLRVLTRARDLGWSLSLQQIFQHQTVRELAREMVRADGEGTASTAPFSLVAAEDLALLPEGLEDAYPLARLQSGMLFHSEYSPESAVYHDIYTVFLRAPFDAGLLGRAVRRAVAAHPVLRTSFDLTSFSEPLQLVHREVPVEIAVTDLSDLASERQGEILAAWMDEEKRRPFDWTKAPLVRFQVHRCGGDTFQLGLGFHHAVLDGWSLSLLLTGLFRSYLALLRGEEPPAPTAAASSYRDFVALERQALTSEETRRYWSERQARDAFGTLPRWPGASGRGSQVCELSLPLDLSEALARVARAAGVPVKTALLAAHLRALAAFTGQSAVVTGLVANGRPETAGGEEVLGLFLNTLPFHLDLPGGTWNDLLRQIFEAERELLEHRRYPMVELQKGGGGRPLFEAAFNYVHFHIYQGLERMSEVQALGQSFYEETSFTFLANFNQDPLTGQIHLRLEFDAGQFPAGQIEALAGAYERLLAALAHHPEDRYELTSPLTGEERRQLAAGSGASPRFPAETPLHELFAAAAARDPQAVAVSCEGRRLTYGELAAEAHRLARRLRRLGIGPESRVGLCLERSPEMIAAILAILQAGGAYVPLDPDLPRERLAFLLEDSGVAALVTHSRLEDRLPETPGLPRLLLDVEGDAPRGVSPVGDTAHVTAENAAYVIYTSGSTGRPKGVVVTHANVARLLSATQDWFGFGPGDTWTLFHSYAFDFSVWEIWGGLAYGGRLVVVPYWVSRSPEAFLDLLESERVTVLNQTPSAFRQLSAAEEASPRRLALRTVIFGGEALDLPGLAPWLSRHGDREPLLVNMYGITETTVHVTYRPLGQADTAAGSVIGIPIPDLQTHVLDRWLEPAPLLVPGEIHVGGAGLARGYLGRPELTAERFVPDPFGPEPGGRLYRSGDLARRLPGGELEYLGRIDHQVKIRGFRIELGEIQAALASHPEVRDAVVLARGRGGDGDRLVAWVVPRGDQAPAVAELRAHLEQRLPAYMVPAVFVPVDALPLTPNGKLDRNALPDPDAARESAGTGTSYAAPRTAAEETLVAIWGEVLGLPRIGIHDNFFELGGDSILSIQITARARQRGLRIAPRQLFEHQTVAELAAVAETGDADALAAATAAEQGPVTGPVPLTPIQRWFFEQEQPEPHHYNHAVLLRTEAPLDPAALQQVTALLLEHHDALRFRFRRGEDGWRQEGTEPGGEVPFTLVDLAALPAPARRAALESSAADLQTSLDLAAGPLLRIASFSHGAGQPGRLFLLVHHLVVDGVSWRILLDDLQAAYGRISRGEPAALPPKTTSFRQWAERLAEHARAEARQADLAYWTAPAHARLRPLDLPRQGDGLNTIASSRTVTVSLPADETTALLSEVPRAYNTRINDALLAALALAFERQTGASAVLVDLEGHGREELDPDLDLSRTVGWFTAIFPVLLDLSAEGGPGGALRAVKETLRALPAQGIGYGLLRYLSDEGAAALGRLPQAEIAFNYLGQLDTVLSAGSSLAAAGESSGLPRSPATRRSHALEINALVAGGCLTCDWTYSERVHRRDGVERLAAGFLEALRDLIAHCRSPEAGGYTPSDFPDLQLSQTQLDDLLEEIGIDFAED